MKTVNLLPEWYTQQQRQKGHLRLHLITMVLMGAAMVAGMGVARARLIAVDRQRVQLEQQAKQVGNPEEELRKQTAELKRLENMQLAYKDLGNTVPMSSVIQQIQNDMTKGMALSRVSVEVHSEPLKGAPFVGPNTTQRLHDVAHLTVEGISSNDVQIAQLIGKISTNPLFSDVSLNYTKTEILRECSVRRFEIQLQMDLEPLSAEDPDTASTSQPAPKSLAEGAAANAG